jgi:hypothetical protein
MTQELLGRVHRELLDVLNSINQDKIHHDGDDFHELLNDVEKALADHAMREVQRLGQEIEHDDIASILACRDMLDAQPVPPRTWVGSGDLEDSNAYLTPPQRTDLPAPVQECFVCDGKGFIGEGGYKCRRCDGVGATLSAEQQAQEPVTITNEMAFAFHGALTDGAIGEGEVEEIKTGLAAAFAHITTPPQRTWVGLTDEEIDNINYTTAHMLAREVEAKLKERNQ